MPFRQQKGSPKGAIVWREVKVAIVARLGLRLSDGDTDSERTETRLVQRRLVACLGNIDDLGQRLCHNRLFCVGLSRYEQVISPVG